MANNNVRASQTVKEVWSLGGSISLHATQLVVITASISGSAVRASQSVVEVIGETGGGAARASQIVFELYGEAGGGYLRASQIVIEFLIPNVEVPVVAIFPELRGLTFDVVKRPLWNTGGGKTASGREVRVGYYAYPMWEWDLQYDYLPDSPANGTTESDLRTLMAFFCQCNGSLYPFLFRDPDDYQVTGQALDTTNGTDTTILLLRSFGAGGYYTTEPIGYVDLTKTFNVYLDGVLQDPSTYTVDQGILGYQILKFVNTPAAGHAVSCDMTYYYACKFKDDTYDWTKFMQALWSMDKITIASTRNG